MMPNTCNRLIVRCRWLQRALAFRCCVKANCATMLSAYFREQRPPLAHRGASHAVAVRTWHNVSSRFFPPMPQGKFAQEGMTHTTQNQMTLNRNKLPNFKVVHAQFRFAILKRAFNRPVGERHPQQGLDQCGFGRVADKISDLVRIQGVSRDQQMMRPRGQSLFIGQVDPHMLGLPDHWSFAALFDMVVDPGLFLHRTGVAQDVTYFHSGIVFHFQTRVVLLASGFIVMGILLVQQVRLLRPGHQIDRHLGDVVLPQTIQSTPFRP